jgi:deoxyuridine 5'-triphosphate nucleotidohydrolase
MSYRMIHTIRRLMCDKFSILCTLAELNEREEREESVGREPIYGECVICGEKFRTKKSHLDRRKTCGKECDNIRRKSMYAGENNPNFGNRGPNNPLFKTGERVSVHGYRLIYKPDHPNANYNGYIREHRFIVSENIGRPLRDDEHVHHKDGNKLNNHIDNLEIVTKSEHTRLHNLEKEIIRDDLGRISMITKRRHEPMRVNVRVMKAAPEVNLPKYQSDFAAGFDIEAFITTPITIPIGERRLIGTGLHFQLPPDYELQLRPRSGLALKNGITLTNAPATIDADFIGEVKVILENRGNAPFVVENGMRICQGVINQVEKAQFSIVEELSQTERGAGGFGSTNV